MSTRGRPPARPRLGSAIGLARALGGARTRDPSARRRRCPGRRRGAALSAPRPPHIGGPHGAVGAGARTVPAARSPRCPCCRCPSCSPSPPPPAAGRAAACGARASCGEESRRGVRVRGAPSPPRPAPPARPPRPAPAVVLEALLEAPPLLLGGLPAAQPRVLQQREAQLSGAPHPHCTRGAGGGLRAPVRAGSGVWVPPFGGQDRPSATRGRGSRPGSLCSSAGGGAGG